MPKFISDDEMEEIDRKTKKFISDDEMASYELNLPNETESALRGAAQGLSLGFADEIVGGAEGAYDALTSDKSFEDAYREARDESRKAYKLAEEANPKSYFSGEVGGNIASALIPGLGLAKGAKAATGIARLAAPAAIAAGEGALQGYGSSSEEGVGAAKDALRGATIGGLFGVGGKIAGEGFDALKDTDMVSKYLKKKANQNAVKALGLERGTAKKILNKRGIGGDEALGDYALRNKLLNFGSSAEDMIEKNADVLSSNAKARQQIYDMIDEAGASKFDPVSVSSKIKEEFGDFDMGASANASRAKKLEDTVELIRRSKTGKIEDLRKAIDARIAKNPDDPGILSMLDEYTRLSQEASGPVSMKEGQKLLEEMQNFSKFETPRPSASDEIAIGAYGKTRDLFNQSAEEAGEAMNVPGLGEKIKSANKEMSMAYDLGDALKNKIAKRSNNDISLTDFITLSGNNPALYVPKKLYERYGSQTKALGFDKLSDMVRKNPQQFGKYAEVLSNASQRGTQALGAAHFILQNKDPEYRKQMYMINNPGEDAEEKFNKPEEE